MIGTILFISSLANQGQQHQQHKEQQQQQAQEDEHQQPKIARSPSVLQRLRSINFYSHRSQEPVSVSSHFKQNSDPNTDYDYPLPQQDHQQASGTETHYLFEPPHQHQDLGTLETETHFQFEQIHQPLQNQALEIETHFDFEQTHKPIQSLAAEKGTHFLPEDEEEEEDGDAQSLEEIYSQLADSHVSRTQSDTKPASGEIPAKLPQKMRKSASMKSAFGHFEEEDIGETRRPATVRERKVKAADDDEEVDAKADDFINKFKQQLKLQRIDSIIRYKEVISRGGGIGK
ncbi:hypothetical protein RJ639_041994 [Escallonia herrerae]|uniref:Uncharacterized protein n=1 Tax=Escallonia herrerae TaxID=1293975 RepID=A0AA89B6X5_9ASTE|nr:hypothetical protein RJ639_041994 [Escallonia herrerae]